MVPDANSSLRLSLRFAAVSTVLAAIVTDECARWGAEPPPPTTVLGAIGRALIERSAEFDDRELRAVFAVVEDVLIAGAEGDKDIVATGLLEAALHVGDRLPAARDRVMSFAGPEARAYCKAWDDFCGIGEPR